VIERWGLLTAGAIALSFQAACLAMSVLVYIGRPAGAASKNLMIGFLACVVSGQTVLSLFPPLIPKLILCFGWLVLCLGSMVSDRVAFILTFWFWTRCRFDGGRLRKTFILIVRGRVYAGVNTIFDAVINTLMGAFLSCMPSDSYFCRQSFHHLL
jgi:hypothetical protein